MQKQPFPVGGESKKFECWGELKIFRTWGLLIWGGGTFAGGSVPHYMPLISYRRTK